MGASSSAIAGKRWKSYFVYKVNVHAKLVWQQTKRNGNAEKIDENGPGKGAEVARSASLLPIRRSARCSVSPLEVLLR